jgi:phosphohistidine phosphatase
MTEPARGRTSAPPPSSLGSSSLSLYLIRHAQAGEQGPDYPDDRLRPLVRKGVRQAAALQRFLVAQGVGFDQLCSSPLLRAAQTAEPLIPLVAQKRVHYLDSLAAADYPQLLTDLRERLAPKDRTAALVGHEPFLGELAAWLLTGDPQGLRVRVRKASVTVLEGELGPGMMTLDSLIPARAYQAL